MKLLEILKRISEGSIDYLKLNYLIETAQKIAYTYLKYRYKNLNRTLMAEDVTYNEMAVEATK